MVNDSHNIEDCRIRYKHFCAGSFLHLPFQNPSPPFSTLISALALLCYISYLNGLSHL